MPWPRYFTIDQRVRSAGHRLRQASGKRGNVRYGHLVDCAADTRRVVRFRPNRATKPVLVGVRLLTTKLVALAASTVMARFSGSSNYSWKSRRSLEDALPEDASQSPSWRPWKVPSRRASCWRMAEWHSAWADSGLPRCRGGLATAVWLGQPQQFQFTWRLSQRIRRGKIIASGRDAIS